MTNFFRQKWDRPRAINAPEPGFFKMRLVKDGPFVPAVILYRRPRDPITDEVLDRSQMWEAWVNGVMEKEPSPDPAAAGVFKIWTAGKPIPAQEFERMSLASAPQPANKSISLSELAPLEP